jgi:hypothetical protein
MNTVTCGSDPMGGMFDESQLGRNPGYRYAKRLPPLDKYVCRSRATHAMMTAKETDVD